MESGTSEESKDGNVDEDGEEKLSKEPDTDAEGWVYGDNKWEGQTGKGGIGKVRGSEYVAGLS